MWGLGKLGNQIRIEEYLTSWLPNYRCANLERELQVEEMWSGS